MSWIIGEKGDAACLFLEGERQAAGEKDCDSIIA